MFEKDYLMRLFTDFMNALNEIINSIDKGDVDGAKIQIQKAYGLLGNDSQFFDKSNIDDILEYFKILDGNYLKRIEMLSEVMSLDANIESDKAKRSKRIEKTIELIEYFIDNSDEYSYQLDNRLKEMKRLNS